MRRLQQSRWWAWGPALAVAVAILPRVPIMTLHEDEGVVTMWALQIDAGRLPYRDFLVGTAPAIPYLYGAGFRLLGSSLLVDRILDGLPMVLATAFVAVAARRLLPAGWAAAVALLWGVWLPAFIGYGAYHFWGPAFVIAMAVALTGPRPRPALAGAAAALGLLFYQAMLPAVAAGLVVALLWRRRPSDAFAFAAGPVAAGLALVGFLAVTGTIVAFIDQTIVVTTGRYQSFNRLPFPWNPLLLGDTLNWHSGIAAVWEFPMFWLIGVAVPFLVVLYAARGLYRSVRHSQDLSLPVAFAIVSTGLFASAFVARVGGPICWLAAPFALALVAHRVRTLTASAAPTRRLLALSPVLFSLVTGLAPVPVGFWLSCTTNPATPLVAVATPAGTVCLRHSEAAQLRAIQPIVAGATHRSPQVTSSEESSRRLVSGARVAFLPTSPGLHQLTGTLPAIPSFWLLPRNTRLSELQRTEAALDRGVGLIVYIEDPELDGGHPWEFDDYLGAKYDAAPVAPGVTVYRRR